MVSAVGEGYPPCPYRALPARIFNAQSRSKGSIPMRRLLLLSFGLFLFALPSSAQSVDASVGYSYFRLGAFGSINQNGVSGSVAHNPNRWLGIGGDFGGYHPPPRGVSLTAPTQLLRHRAAL